MAQTLLHQRQHLGIVHRFGIQDAFGREPGLVEPRREQVAASHHPQYRPPGTRGDPGEEQGGCGIVPHTRACGRDLVQRIEPQSAVREP